MIANRDQDINTDSGLERSEIDIVVVTSFILYSSCSSFHPKLQVDNRNAKRQKPITNHHLFIIIYLRLTYFVEQMTDSLTIS